MKAPFVSRSHFIYEVDNIPDHRSRRFGCSASQMAIRELRMTKKKSRIQAATRVRLAQNEPPTKVIPSALS